MDVPESLETTIRNFFHTNGYYLAKGVYSEALLQLMEIDFDRIVEQLEGTGENINARWESANTDALDGGASRIVHTHNVQRYSSCLLQALQHETFLDIVEQILGPDIVLHHTKLFQKPPRAGAPFPTHQDWTYFPSHDDTMIAATIFLSDADERSGGLRVYPGSHELGRQAGTSGHEPSDLLDKYPLEGAQPVNAERGDVIFFSYFTLHGSTPNRSEQIRKTILAQMHSGQDYLLPKAGKSHVNESLVLRGWNHHMSRELANI